MVALSPSARAAALEAMHAGPLDVLVVGGGITGAGVALDAATRGLRVGLVERRDYASGTSSRSSKLVHGGLRYLQQRDFRLVAEGLAERHRTLRMAPHLVHPLPFLIPLFGVRRRLRFAIGGVLWAYDLVGGLRIGHRHRWVAARKVAELAPGLDPTKVRGGYLYWDAQADDARLTLAVLRTAAAHGAHLANDAEVVALVEDDGRVAGVRVRDGTSGAILEIRARVVVNATGVFAEEVARLEADPGAVQAVRPAKGAHIVVPRRLLDVRVATTLPVPDDKRVIFVIPWGRAGGVRTEAALPAEDHDELVVIGTTDTDYTGDLDRPLATAEDVAYLLRAVNAWFSGPVTAADVVGTFAGTRPLLHARVSQRTADLSRRHAVTVSRGGLVSVTGGKLTTWRRMAADAVDVAVARLGVKTRSRTKEIRLVGARLDGSPADARPAGGALPEDVIAHLVGRYGAEAGTVAALAAGDATLGEALVPGRPYIRAEVVHAARTEGARHVEDVLARRTRLIFELADRGAGAADAVAGILAAELGWDDATRAAEVEAYRAEVERILAAERAPVG
jgi:glycerol-3-phosphate dehydrogenase